MMSGPYLHFPPLCSVAPQNSVSLQGSCPQEPLSSLSLSLSLPHCWLSLSIRTDKAANSNSAPQIASSPQLFSIHHLWLPALSNSRNHPTDILTGHSVQWDVNSTWAESLIVLLAQDPQCLAHSSFSISLWYGSIFHFTDETI